jgi:hypothetical protein
VRRLHVRLRSAPAICLVWSGGLNDRAARPAREESLSKPSPRTSAVLAASGQSVGPAATTFGGDTMAARPRCGGSPRVGRYAASAARAAGHKP